MKVPVTLQNIKLFEALSSETRIKALEALANGPKNIGELARLTNVSAAIMTRHIALMEAAGLIRTEHIAGKRGTQKMCSLGVREITLSLLSGSEAGNFASVSIPIGQYSAYEVSPTCGLSSTEGMLGLCDDPRYFSDPARVQAAILWFQSGWVEYSIPSYIFTSPHIDTLEISLEICSEFPGYNENWPSDIVFSLNGVSVGMWTSPGDFGARRGVHTPAWWWGERTQYGLLKTLRITREQTMLDGIPLSDVSLDSLRIDPKHDVPFRIAAPGDARHPGGVTLFGRGFGNYDQHIEVRVEYA